MTIKTYIRELPNDIEVTLSVESVFKKDEADNCFRLECRVCDGEHVGSLINIYFYRMRKDGTAARKDTASLLQECNPGKSADEVASWEMNGKIFKTTPWLPPTSKYQMYGRFKFVGTNDVF